MISDLASGNRTRDMALGSEMKRWDKISETRRDDGVRITDDSPEPANLTRDHFSSWSVLALRHTACASSGRSGVRIRGRGEALG